MVPLLTIFPNVNAASSRLMNIEEALIIVLYDLFETVVTVPWLSTLPLILDALLSPMYIFFFVFQIPLLTNVPST